jgi:uncharacterized protein YraI
MKITLRILALMLIVLSVACAPTSNIAAPDVAQGPAAWIDAPLDNSNLPQAEYQVVSHASDPGGISAFELSVNGQVLRTDPAPGDQVGTSISHISQPWLPPAPGTYLLEVRAKNTGGTFGPSASANVTVGGVRQMSPTIKASATVTYTPTVSPTAAPTSAPTGTTPTATGLQNTNCHTGPGGSYEVSGTLFKGKSIQIDGINADNTWVWVKHPNFTNGHCWVSIPFIQVQGSLNTLPVIPAPPLPATSEPRPTATDVHH